MDFYAKSKVEEISTQNTYKHMILTAWCAAIAIAACGCAPSRSRCCCCCRFSCCLWCSSVLVMLLRVDITSKWNAFHLIVTQKLARLLNFIYFSLFVFALSEWHCVYALIWLCTPLFHIQSKTIQKKTKKWNSIQNRMHQREKRKKRIEETAEIFTSVLFFAMRVCLCLCVRAWNSE